MQKLKPQNEVCQIKQFKCEVYNENLESGSEFAKETKSCCGNVITSCCAFIASFVGALNSKIEQPKKEACKLNCTKFNTKLLKSFYTKTPMCIAIQTCKKTRHI